MSVITATGLYVLADAFYESGDLEAFGTVFNYVHEQDRYRRQH